MSIVSLCRLLLCCVVMLAACSAESSEPPTANPIPDTEPTAAPETAGNPGDSAQQPQPAAPSQFDEPVVAVVNGSPITQAEFEREMNRARQQVDPADMAALQASVLDTLIEQEVIEQAATQRQITVTDNEVDLELQVSRTLVDSDAAWQQWLTDNLYTEEEYRESLRAALIAGKLRDNITANLPDTMPQIHARHILVGSEAQANNALARLQNGEDFAAVAAELSQDVTTREQGGDLGWFAEGELWESSLAQVAFSLEPGQIAGPVPTRLGYHIIQTLAREDRPLSEEFQRPLMAQVMFERWLQETIRSAVIERFPA